MNFSVTKELLFRHFMGKTSAIQKQFIDEWASVKANEELYYAWLEEYENMHPEYAADLERAITSYHHFLKRNKSGAFNEITDNIPGKVEPTRRRFLFTAVAACISLVILFLGLRSSHVWKYRTLSTGYGQTRTFHLSDGSSVTLNANSSLKIPRWGFGETNRSVFLEGEATFSVTHSHTNQKFIVQTAKQFEIEVLGTEFTVFSREGEARVALNKGKVQINLHEGGSTRKMVMKPGDLVTLDKENNVVKKSTLKPGTHAGWQSHRYVFEQTSLQEIIHILQENYGMNVEVNDQNLLSLTVTGTLTADSADHILELIETVLGLQIRKADKRVLISQNNQ
jgi:transmembrane sensor